ncbi:MAG: LysR family transcriptional regulator [Alcaligenaceae bacterium]|nr:LysR family transcriptional regulator [Alcaligenaceae bacterium]
MRLNLHLLRVFHNVAQEGSFSAAARQLYISQPAVSKAVSELERQLDTALIERIRAKAGQGLVLTDAGLALNAHARAIFSLEHAAIEDLQARSGLKRGELIIGASTTIASYWLPRYLQAFSRHWPDIVLKVVAANTQSIVEDLYDCRLDMALVEGPVQQEGVAYYPWKEEQLVIVAPPGFFHTQSEAEHVETGLSDAAQKALWVSERDLFDSTWLMREAGSGTREVVLDLLARQGMQLRRTIEIGSNEGIARGVAAGLGVAMLPFAVAEDLLLLGRVIELRVNDMPGLSRSLYRLERKDRPASRVVAAFLDILSRPA